MKTELKDKAIKMIVEDVEGLKATTARYYNSENKKKTDELLKIMSRERVSINAKLDLLLDLDIITIDEWTIARRLIIIVI